MRHVKSTLWVVPLGAEPLGQDGKQLFYGTPDGLGSVIPLGNMVDVTLDLAYEPDPPHRWPWTLPF